MTGLSLVVCSMMLARRMQLSDHQSWSLNVEPGDPGVMYFKCHVDTAY